MIELQGLSKTYRALLGGQSVHALNDLTLTVGRGEVLGIAGPNGAGKSTLISLLLGFLRPSAGTATIHGMAPRAYIERHGVAYLAELVAIPPQWSIEGTLRRGATLVGVPAATRRARVEEMLDRFELTEQRKKRVGQLSKGNLQRLGLAQALVGEHGLVILDEPSYGLDPVWVQRLREIIRELRTPNRTILIASHNLDELERLADRVVILHRGRAERVVSTGGAAVTEGRTRYRLRLTEPHAAVARVFPEAEPAEGRADEWRVDGEVRALNHGLAELMSQGAVVVSFMPDESRLENEFHMAMGGGR